MNKEIMQDVEEQLAGALAYDKAAKKCFVAEKGAGLYFEADRTRI